MIDLINHPPHYTAHPSGVECIQITEHMGFNLGNAVKYIWRADLKGNQLADLEKAAWYIQREINRINGASEPEPTEWTDEAVNAMVDQRAKTVNRSAVDGCQCYRCRDARVHGIHVDGDPTAIAAKIAVEPVGTMGRGVGQFQDAPHGNGCPCYSCRIRFARRSAFGAQQNRIYGGECDV